ncbi:type I-E CRISPR-associated protein Cas6/Cse3/CasE [Streptomyces sp. NPDC002506]|uniref:type I-E CRISPR-associated protein Cas6/Cse3/CasE n=1 Tax=Streptomyces sp. NPDC002506 TaxID=3154536 RepID=UPI00332C25FB
MYLTRFRFNTARPGARKLLTSPQATHAAVMSAFPTILPTQDDTPRVLWRLDHNAKAENLLYIVSPDQPDLTHLVEQGGWPAAAASGTPGWQTYDYAAFLTGLSEGSTWSFRLTANPVHHVRIKDGAPTKRTAHRTPAHQIGWLLEPERQQRCGFSILTTPQDKRLTEHGDTHQVTIAEHRRLDFAKRDEPTPTKHRVQVTTVTYNGRLQVTDPGALRRALVQGIGKAKAYGCGLMTLAPLT